MQYSEHEIEFLFSPQCIRQRCKAILDLAEAGETNFEIRHNYIGELVDLLVQTTRERYPDLKIPFHSRWSHFQVGQVDRLSQMGSLTGEERTRSLLDLVVTSVLLDAGAGMRWKFQEGDQVFSKSEGLAVASFHLFNNGAFDFEGRKEAHAEALQKLEMTDLAEGFQVSSDNPLAGLEGRLLLMHQLGKAVKQQERYFLGPDGSHRPGNLLYYFKKRAAETGGKLSAVTLLRTIQDSLGSIWPGRLSLAGKNLGDVWSYAPLGEGIEGLIPFHKLSQWLTYSLIEPLIEQGLDISETDQLTGLAEYRNGGLLVDGGVLSLRNPQLAEKEHEPGSELIVEWRALTLALIEKLAPLVRKKLGVNQEQMPLGKILEGGTWAAGRKLASAMRADGGPPLKLKSDGTVF